MPKKGLTNREHELFVKGMVVGMVVSIISFAIVLTITYVLLKSKGLIN